IAVRLRPDDSATRYALAQTFEKLGRASEAEVQRQAAQEENRRKRDASLATSDIILGTELLQKGDAAAAEGKLQEAVRLNPRDPLAHYNYGLALLVENRLDNAIAQFRAALELRSDDADTLYYLGRALLAKDQPAGAATCLKQALGINPDDAHAHNVLAVTLARMKDIAAAGNELHRARALEPGNSLYERNLACLERAMRDCDLVP
ncbi:MAG TPA: tetratricopeptide repeat protein, partial [Bryobacteraceae bacterium]|nr:tetratricopeptide repeat protein [Bryobacteraceae bacterium]